MQKSLDYVSDYELESLDYVSDYELESACKDAPLHSPI